MSMKDELQELQKLGDLGSYQLNRRRLLQLTGYGAAGIAGASLLAACGGPSNTTPTVTSIGPINTLPQTNGNGARQLATYFLGYNAEPINSPSWNDPTYAQAVAQFKPGTLRYPGGTVANYWD